MIAKYICFEKKCLAVLKERELSAPSADQVLVANDYTILSAGTECANYRGLPNTNAAREGFPWNPGYSASGHVIECGPEVKDLKVGDRVVSHWGGHTSHNLWNENRVVKVEDDRVKQLDAAFAHIASFPMLAIRNLRIELGESVMVAGQGLLGLIAVQLAALSGGLPVWAADLSPARRELSLSLGADRVFDPGAPDYVESVMAATGGKGINCIVEVTGFASALQEVLKYTARFGRISLLGCSRIADAVIDFYEYVHRRGVVLMGGNTTARPEVESRPGAWTHMDDERVLLKLLATGKLKVRPLISQIVSPADANEVYQSIVTQKEPPLGFAFDWSKVR